MGPIVVDGNLTVEATSLYQNEQGDMSLTLYAYNGTDENRSIYDAVSYTHLFHRNPIFPARICG